MELTGKNNSWGVKTGLIGLHPAKRNGLLVKNRVRIIGKVPPGSWPQGFRGFMAPATGKAPNTCLLYLFPEDHLQQWLSDGGSKRSPDQVVTFQVQDTLRFSVYRHSHHPVVQALRLATKMEFFGHTRTRYHVLLDGDSMTIRVPERADIQPHRQYGQRDDNQGELL